MRVSDVKDVKVLPVPRGSLIVLIDVGSGDTPDEESPVDEHFDHSMMGDLIKGLIEKCGHNEFVILEVNSGDGKVEVFGSVDEAVARVKTALVIAGVTKPDE